jgi:hypothetical protein
MNYHAYEDYYPFTNGSGAVQCDYLFIRDFKDFLAGHGLASRDLWATETDFCQTYIEGGRTATQTDNARFLARSYPFALACGVGHIFMTELAYDSHFPDHLNWAVPVDSNGNRRAIFYVYKKMIEKLEGFVQPQLEDYGSGNPGARFLVGTNPIWVVWNYSNLTRTAQVPVGSYGQARVTQALPASFDNYGATWTVATAAVANGYADIAASSNAVYVEPFGPAGTTVLLASRAGPNGTVTPATTNVAVGGSATFSVNGALYYRIQTIATNGMATGLVFGNASTSTNFVWSNVQAAGTVTVTFAEQVVDDPAATPYWWLAQYGLALDTNAVNGSCSDTDNDGHVAWQDREAGTIPTNEQSVLKVLSLGLETGPGLVLRWNTVTGRTYAVQVAPSLPAPASWSNAPGAGALPGTGGQRAFTNPPAGPTNRFFRVKVWR